MTDRHLSLPPPPLPIMAPAEVTTLSIANGGSASAATPKAYLPSPGDAESRRPSLGSITFGLWELAVNSAIRLASVRKKGGGLNKTTTATSTNPSTSTTAEGGCGGDGGGGLPLPLHPQRALPPPPLPRVPPVGPGGRRRPSRSHPVTRSQSLRSEWDPPGCEAAPSSPTLQARRGVLTRSQSMADLFSSLVAARLKPVATFTRSTHCQLCNQRFSLIFRRHHCRMCQTSVCAYCSTYQKMTSGMEEEEDAETLKSPHSEEDEPEDRDRGEGGGGGGDGRREGGLESAGRGGGSEGREGEGGGRGGRRGGGGGGEGGLQSAGRGGGSEGREGEGGGRGGRRGGGDGRREGGLQYAGRFSEEEERVKRKATTSKTESKSLYRVCRNCASELEGKQSVRSRTWTEEFTSLRQFFKQGRQTGVPESVHLLPPRIPRLPPTCERVARCFLQECKENATRSKSLLQSTSMSLNAGLQYALKPPGQKVCSSCSRLLRFSVERKTCTLCTEVFCRYCTSLHLELTMPADLDPGDTRHEVTQVGVRVLTPEEAEELDGSSRYSSNGAMGSPPAKQRYRVCEECREHVRHVMEVMTFNETLTYVQAELVDLQEQIAAVLDEQDTPSPGIGLTRWPSVRSVTKYSSLEDESVGEAVNERVAGKLLDRFFMVYLQLEQLQPVTATQGVLYKHVKQTMSSFYMSRRSVSSKRFNRRDTISSLHGGFK